MMDETTKGDIGLKSMELFCDWNKTISNLSYFRGNTEKLEMLYYSLSRTILHEKGQHEFKRRFEKKIGEQIIIDDYNSPSCDNSRDSVLLTYEGGKIVKMKLGETKLNVNFKYRLPTYKYKSVGLKLYHFNKYIKNKVNVIFMVPYPSTPEYYSQKENPKNGVNSAENHKFYYLKTEDIKEGTICGMYRYYKLDELLDMDTLTKEQLKLGDFI